MGKKRGTKAGHTLSRQNALCSAPNVDTHKSRAVGITHVQGVTSKDVDGSNTYLQKPNNERLKGKEGEQCNLLNAKVRKKGNVLPPSS